MIEQIYLKGYTRNPETSEKYYKVSLKTNYDNLQYLSLHTMYIREENGYEIRKAGLINPEIVFKDFKENFRQNISILNEIEDLKAFFSVGGHAIVNESLVQDHWPEILTPRISIPQHSFEGFIDYSSLDQKNFARSPRGKFRQEILKRDGNKCRFCDKRQDENEDVRLQIHHIQPWSENGLTIAPNLITLCVPCHEKVKNIDRALLLAKVGVKMPLYGAHFIDIEKSSREICIRMKLYNENSVTCKLPKQ